MNNWVFDEKFEQKRLDARLEWYNPPQNWQIHNSCLVEWDTLITGGKKRTWAILRITAICDRAVRRFLIKVTTHVLLPGASIRSVVLMVCAFPRPVG